jgi:hypothetical protein
MAHVATGIPTPRLSQQDAENPRQRRLQRDPERRRQDQMRAAVLTRFVTAASLVVSLGAAWWAAIKGGQHRDNAAPARFGFGQRRRPTSR